MRDKIVLEKVLDRRRMIWYYIKVAADAANRKRQKVLKKVLDSQTKI